MSGEMQQFVRGLFQPMVPRPPVDDLGLGSAVLDGGDRPHPAPAWHFLLSIAYGDPNAKGLPDALIIDLVDDVLNYNGHLPVTANSTKILVATIRKGLAGLNEYMSGTTQ
jgi:hypothetical protein